MIFQTRVQEECPPSAISTVFAPKVRPWHWQIFLPKPNFPRGAHTNTEEKKTKDTNAGSMQGQTWLPWYLVMEVDEYYKLKFSHSRRSHNSLTWGETKNRQRKQNPTKQGGERRKRNKDTMQVPVNRNKGKPGSPISTGRTSINQYPHHESK